MENTGNIKPIQFISILPIVFAIAIIPLIVRLRVIKLLEIEKVLWKDVDSVYDFFNKAKIDWFIFALVFMLIVLMIRLMVGNIKLKFSTTFIPLVLYIAMISISSVLARYKYIFIKKAAGLSNLPENVLDGNITLRGFWDRYEGVLMLVGYVLFFFLIYLLVDNIKMIDMFIIAMSISTIVIGLISLGQFFGLDILQSDIGLRMLIPSNYSELRQSVDFTFGKYISYATLYNPNYAGGYMAVVTPIYVAFFIKNDRYRGVYLTSSIFGFTGLLTSGSLTGQISFAVAMLFMFVILLLKKVKFNWKKIAQFLSVFIIVFVILFIYKTTYKDVGESYVTYDSGNIQQINHTIHGLEFVMVNNYLRLQLDDGSLQIMNDRNEALVVEESNGFLVFQDQHFSDIKMQIISDGQGMNLIIGDRTVTLAFTSNQIQIFGAGGLLYDEGFEADGIGFKGYELFGSGRGYIWSRTIPIIKDCLILGVGADAYATVFPQYDIIGKVNYLKSTAILVDKPHNFYLQTLVNSGGVALILYISVVIYILIQGMFFLFNVGLDNRYSLSIVGFISAIIAFLVSGLGNDSVVSISIIHWFTLATLLGIVEIGKVEIARVKNNI